MSTVLCIHNLQNFAKRFVMEFSFIKINKAYFFFSGTQIIKSNKKYNSRFGVNKFKIFHDIMIIMLHIIFCFMIFMSNIFISYVFYIKSSARKVTITDKMAGTATPGVPKIKFSDRYFHFNILVHRQPMIRKR